MNETAEVTEPKVDVETSESNQDQPQEFEIKLDSPSDTRKGSPMVARIIGQRDKARVERDDARSEVDELRQQVANLQQQVGGKSNAVPKYEDYQDQDQYQRAVQSYYAQQLAPKAAEPTVDPYEQFNRQQRVSAGIERHYKKADALATKFPDYSVAEQTATQILGDSIVQDIATRANNSAELMLYFGKNPNEAARFKALVDSDPVNAGIELGRLDQKIKIESKVKQDVPEPDEPLEGGSNKAVTAQSWQKQLDKLRDKGDLKGAIALKKQARGQGVDLN